MEISVHQKSITKMVGNKEMIRDGQDIVDLGLVEGYRRKSRTVYCDMGWADEHYTVTINFREGNLKIRDHYCTCLQSRYDDYCVHFVSALLGMKFNVPTPMYRSNPKMDLLPYLVGETVPKEFPKKEMYVFAGFGSSMNTSARIPIKLEITCECQRGYFGGREPFTWTLNMKAGESKLYVVKSISEFVSAALNGRRLVFGKKFAYDPQKHRLSDEQRRLLEFLAVLSDATYMGGYSSYGRPKYVDGKSAHIIGDAMIHQFLKAVEGVPFTLIAGDGSELVMLTAEVDRIHDDYMSGGLKVSAQANGDLTVVRNKTEQKMIRVTQKGDYILTDGKLYHIDRDRLELMNSVDHLFSRHGSVLHVPKEHEQDFATRVYPILQAAGDIQLPQSLGEKIVSSAPVSKVYFERRGSSKLTGRVVHEYGAQEDKYVLKDLEAESAVEAYFQGFDRDDKGYILDDYEQIYVFVTEKLPELRQAAEVYLQKGLQLTAQNFPKFTTSLALGTGAYLEVNIEGLSYDAKDLKRIYNSIREKKQYVQLQDGSLLNLEVEEANDLKTLVETLDIEGEELSEGGLKVPLARAVAMEQKIDDTSVELIRDEAYEHFLSRFRNPQGYGLQLPEKYEDIMRDYQKKGFEWLSTLSAYGLGGILADDMGLGKTLQTIAYLDAVKEEEKLPALVIAPSSLIYNWQEEVHKFAPSLSVLVLAGSKAERQRLHDTVTTYDIVVTSYSLIARDMDFYEKHEFGVCVIDEAQKIKNPASQSSKAVKRVKTHKRFALTGTPVENNLTELWSVFDFIMPGYLHGMGDFQKYYERPITKKNKDALQNLKAHTEPFILRRLKKDVLTELPPKIETKAVAHMTVEQQKVYLAYLQQARDAVAGDLEGEGFNQSRFKIFSYLTRLRQICCHPATFVDGYEGDSGKLNMLEEILSDSLEADHRVLLFSQFTGMLEIIRGRLDDMGITYDYLDGSTKVKDRLAKVNAFNEGDTSVFLISLKAGGTGLNLTGADVVIHYDPWWNPAVEDQATDRAYRIGQKNRVQVFKLITQGTIEEKIFELQQMKKDMIDAVIAPGETMLNKMSEAEVVALFE